MVLRLPQMVAGASGGGLWNGGLGAAVPATFPISGLDVAPGDVSALSDALNSLFPPAPTPTYPGPPPTGPADTIPGYNSPWRQPGDLSKDVRSYRDPVTGYLHYENGLEPTPPPEGWTPGSHTGGSAYWGANPPPILNSADGSHPFRGGMPPSPVMQGLEMLPDGRYWRPEGPGDVPSSGNIIDPASYGGGVQPSSYGPGQGGVSYFGTPPSWLQTTGVDMPKFTKAPTGGVIRPPGWPPYETDPEKRFQDQLKRFQDQIDAGIMPQPPYPPGIKEKLVFPPSWASAPINPGLLPGVTPRPPGVGPQPPMGPVAPMPKPPPMGVMPFGPVPKPSPVDSYSDVPRPRRPVNWALDIAGN